MEKKDQNTGLNYFRIKTEWTKEMESGDLGKVKAEELVLATSYSEAEKVAYEIAEDYNRTHYGPITLEIVKTKIADVIFNDIFEQEPSDIENMTCNYFAEDEDSSVGLYAVKIMYIAKDDKGKEKKTLETMYIPAESNSDAIKRIHDYLSTTLCDYVIRETKFDKASALYLPNDIQKSKEMAQ